MIKKFKYKQESLPKIKKLASDKINYGTNWPVVYILYNDKKAYIGETLNVHRRISQHLKNSKKTGYKDMVIIIDDEFNKSATLDIESKLIKYMSADKKLDNINEGLYNYNFYDKSRYVVKFEPLWNKLKELGIINKRLIEIENSNLFTYSPYKALSSDQVEVVDTILQELKEAIKNNYEVTFIVKGKFGTGKTVLATYLMKLLRTPSEVRFGELEDNVELDKELYKTLDGLKTGMVVPLQSLRTTIEKVFKNVSELKASDVIGPYDVNKKDYDLLIVDESRRLQRKPKDGVRLPAYKNKIQTTDLEDGSNELDWILHYSKYQILFYAEDQTIRPTDLTKEEFANSLKGRKIIELNLDSQMRVKGGKTYIDYIEKLLNCTIKQKIDFKKYDYDFRFFEKFEDMYKEIHAKDKKYGYARLAAGYSWNWKSKKDNTGKVYDIEIEEIKLRWNHTYIDWINSPGAIDEVGCIHTISGYDLNYCGVIFEPEIDYDSNKNTIVINRKNYKDREGKKRRPE